MFFCYDYVMKKTLGIILSFIILGGLTYFFAFRNSTTENVSPSSIPTIENIDREIGKNNNNNNDSGPNDNNRGPAPDNDASASGGRRPNSSDRSGGPKNNGS